MPRQALATDAATALIQGKRDTQEDALAADFPIGADGGIVVLADGMGGHAAGEVASTITVTEVFSELKLHRAQLAGEATHVLRHQSEPMVDTKDPMSRSTRETHPK